MSDVDIALLLLRSTVKLPRVVQELEYMRNHELWNKLSVTDSSY